ncbi:TetR/AcrR family transcriptional regulator [Streptomyces sp. NPDC007205]|uniref:TetR/AcrR family transcriptional regulator n=1 Tax=Streptomyces sp. NPDC007205 TaxID=3154316 RepID=UPI0033F1584A
MTTKRRDTSSGRRESTDLLSAAFSGDPDAADTGGGPAARGRRTREKIADAVLALLDEGHSQFPAEQVAQRAGVSRRLVFHHFADMSALADAAIERRLQQIAAQARPLPTEGPRAARVDALTEQRARILEWLTPAYLAVLRLDDPSPRIRQTAQQLLEFARSRLAEVFSAELDRLPEEKRTDLLNALDAVTTWAAWHHWRSAGLDAETARRTMRTAVHALLTATDPPA